jgi:hypothetical protein
MKLSSTEWEDWFAWRPVLVHDQVPSKHRDKVRIFGESNPYGPNQPINWYWLQWLERRRCIDTYDGARITSRYVYRLPTEIGVRE